MGFFGFFGTFANKVAQTWLVLRETWHSTQFGIYYCVVVVRIADNSYMLQLRAKLRFYGF